jgi:glycosyltransferase involved in cell wall biosynthesis
MLPRKEVRNLVRAFALLVKQVEAAAPQERALELGAAHNASLTTQCTPTLLLVGGETSDPDPAATPEIGALQRLAADLGIADRVRFTGKRQPDELRDYYSAGDVAVTTPWYEPFGLTPLEGMACGRPVIGSAVGGITFTIQHGVTGFLVPPRDPAALAARLYQLWERPDLRDRMGRAARARVEREFTWRTVARRTAALYQTLLTTNDEQPVLSGGALWAKERTTNGQQTNNPSSFVLRPSSFGRRMGGE